jgi:hypothetical protein
MLLGSLPMDRVSKLGHAGDFVAEVRSMSAGGGTQTGSQVGADSLDATLMDRVDEVIRSHQKPILSTTGHQDAIEELARRYDGLEIAVREIALEVQKLVTLQKS